MHFIPKERTVVYCQYGLEFCLYSLIFFLPFAKAGVEILAALGTLLWILKRVLGYRTDGAWRFFPPTPLNKAIAAFLLTNLLSVAMSVNPGLSFPAFASKILKFVAIYFIVVETFVVEKNFRRLCLVLTASAVLIGADAAVQVVRGVDFLRGYSAGSLTASFSNPNNFAGWLVVVIPVFAGMALASGSKFLSFRFRMLWWALALFLFVCLLLTCSRGAWVGIFIGSLLSLYYFLKTSSAGKKMMLSRIFAGVLLATAVLALPIKNKVMAGGKPGSHFDWVMKKQISSTRSSVIRKNLWKESLRLLEDFPLVGSGLNTYAWVAPFYKTFDGGGIYPHNSFLQMASETGVLGLFSFLWILFEFFKYTWGYVNAKRDLVGLGMMAGIAASLVQSFFDTNLYCLQLVVLFWFMLGVAVARGQHKSRPILPPGGLDG